MTAQPNTALAAPRSNFDRIRALARSDEVLSRFAEVLGAQAPTYISSVLIAVQNNPTLMDCTPQSIIQSAMRAATLRLSCDPALGQAHIVPYKDHGTPKAQFQLGYKGYIQLAMRTGKYRILNVATVYEGQTVNEDQMKGIHFIKGFRTSETPIGYMLYFQLVNGYEKTFYMTVDELRAHAERYSKGLARPDSPWKTHTVDMMKKTVIRLGLSKWGYFDPNDALAMGAKAEEETPADDSDVIDNDDIPAPAPRRPEKEILAELGYGDEPGPIEQAAADLGGIKSDDQNEQGELFNA